MTLLGFGLLALLVVLGPAIWLYTPDRRLVDLQTAYMPAGTADLEVAGIRLRLRDTGVRDGPAVMLLHGFGSSLETWEGWAAALNGRHRVIRFDLPGFGLTGPDPTRDYSDERAIAIITALMDRLGIQEASFIGNSLGGRIAWRLAAAAPARVAKLVLVSPDGYASPGFTYGTAPVLPFVMKLLPYTLPKFMLRMNLAVAYADPKKLRDATLVRYRDMMLAPGNRTAMLDRMRQTILVEPAPMLRTITVATLILWGEADRMIPFANAAEYMREIPGAALASLPGLGHVPFEEAAMESLPPVLAFLAP